MAVNAKKRIKVKMRIKFPDLDFEKTMAKDIRIIEKIMSRFLERPRSEKRRSFSLQLKLRKEKMSMRAMRRPTARGRIISRNPERWFRLTNVPVTESRLYTFQ
jgi:hypothetical protein